MKMRNTNAYIFYLLKYPVETDSPQSIILFGYFITSEKRIKPYSTIKWFHCWPYLAVYFTPCRYRCGPAQLEPTLRSPERLMIQHTWGHASQARVSIWRALCGMKLRRVSLPSWLEACLVQLLNSFGSKSWIKHCELLSMQIILGCLWKTEH